MGRTKGGIPTVVSLQWSIVSSAANNFVDMIHKYWDITWKNEFAEFFMARERPKQRGAEVPQDLIDASVDRTTELMTKIWSVLSEFEESCATLISDMLQTASNSDYLQALSSSGHLVLKIGAFFTALDGLEKLKQIERNKGKLLELGNQGLIS